MKLYRITFARTGETVVGDSGKCANALRLTLQSFYSEVSRQARMNRPHRWYKVERIGTVERGICKHRDRCEYDKADCAHCAEFEEEA